MFESKRFKRLEHQHAVIADENEDLRRELTAYKKEAREVNDLRLKALTELKAVQENYRDANIEIDELKKKVRLQNEADLMFISVKIIAELLKGKPKEKLQSEKDRLIALQQQYSYAQRTVYPGQAPNFNGLLDLFHSTGL